MPNNARLHDVSKYATRPANNVSVRHLGGKLIRRLNAILQWNDRCVRAEHRADVYGSFRHHPRLDGYQDNIDPSYLFGVIGSRKCIRRKLSIALRTLYPQSLCTKRVQVRPPRNERYVMLAGVDESTAEVRADSSRAKDGNPHRFPLRRAELSITGVAEARHDKATLIQAFIQTGDMDADIRMITLQTLNSLRRGD